MRELLRQFHYEKSEALSPLPQIFSANGFHTSPNHQIAKSYLAAASIGAPSMPVGGVSTSWSVGIVP
jgi:hypothetical protein